MSNQVSVLIVEDQANGKRIALRMETEAGDLAAPNRCHISRCDMAKCIQFADMVRKYANEVLGNKTVVDFTATPTGQPN